MKVLFKNARIYQGHKKPIFLGCLTVNDNRISYVGKDIPTSDFDKVIDCNENLLMPGFKNAHAHGPMCFYRSASDDLSLSDWLFTKILPREDKLKSEDIYYLMKLACLESLQSGITATFEYYFGIPEMMRAQRDIGIRGANLITLTPTIPEPEDCDQRMSKNDLNLLVNYRMGMHSVYTNGRDKFKEASRIIHQYKIPFYIHCSETSDEVNNCKRDYDNMTPVELLNSYGLFDYGGAIFHGVFLSDNDIKILKEHNVSVISCPGSNLKLASGIADLSKLLDNGINVAIGTDGPASNNSIDMFKEMYLASTLQKLLYKDAAKMDATDILEMAISGGAKALDWNDCDSLEVGKLADIIMIDMSYPSMRPIHNILKNIVYSGSKDIVKMTMVDGKILYYDHKFYIDEDVNIILNEVQRISEDILKR